MVAQVDLCEGLGGGGRCGTPEVGAGALRQMRQSSSSVGNGSTSLVAVAVAALLLFVAPPQRVAAESARDMISSQEAASSFSTTLRSVPTKEREGALQPQLAIELEEKLPPMAANDVVFGGTLSSQAVRGSFENDEASTSHIAHTVAEGQRHGWQLDMESNGAPSSSPSSLPSPSTSASPPPSTLPLPSTSATPSIKPLDMEYAGQDSSANTDAQVSNPPPPLMAPTLDVENSTSTLDTANNITDSQQTSTLPAAVEAESLAPTRPLLPAAPETTPTTAGLPTTEHTHANPLVPASPQQHRSTIDVQRPKAMPAATANANAKDPSKGSSWFSEVEAKIYRHTAEHAVPLNNNKQDSSSLSTVQGGSDEFTSSTMSFTAAGAAAAAAEQSRGSKSADTRSGGESASAGEGTHPKTRLGASADPAKSSRQLFSKDNPPTIHDVCSMVTVLIKTFERAPCLLGTLHSIRRRYPTLRIIIVDDSKSVAATQDWVKSLGTGVDYFAVGFDVGVSAGRNFGVSKVETEYVLVLDDDQFFSDKTQLESMLLEATLSSADIVGGCNSENDPNPSTSCRGDWEMFMADKQMTVASPTPTFRTLHILSPPHRHMEHLKQHNGMVDTSNMYCKDSDMVSSFFLARTDFVARQNRWDPFFKVGEMTDFFYRAKMGRARVRFCTHISVEHRQNMCLPTEDLHDRYDRFRDREGMFLEYFFIKHAPVSTMRLPSVIVSYTCGCDEENLGSYEYPYRCNDRVRATNIQDREDCFAEWTNLGSFGDTNDPYGTGDLSPDEGVNGYDDSAYVAHSMRPTPGGHAMPGSNARPLQGAPQRRKQQDGFKDLSLSANMMETFNTPGTATAKPHVQLEPSQEIEVSTASLQSASERSDDSANATVQTTMASTNPSSPPAAVDDLGVTESESRPSSLMDDRA